jgi:hypothetical protein
LGVGLTRVLSKEDSEWWIIKAYSDKAIYRDVFITALELLFKMFMRSKLSFNLRSNRTIVNLISGIRGESHPFTETSLLSILVKSFKLPLCDDRLATLQLNFLQQLLLVSPSAFAVPLLSQAFTRLLPSFPTKLMALLKVSLRLLIASRHYSTLDRLLESVFTKPRLAWVMAQRDGFTLISLLVSHCGLVI